jgi:hypothetical protein
MQPDVHSETMAFVRSACYEGGRVRAEESYIDWHVACFVTLENWPFFSLPESVVWNIPFIS